MNLHDRNLPCPEPDTSWATKDEYSECMPPPTTTCLLSSAFRGRRHTFLTNSIGFGVFYPAKITLTLAVIIANNKVLCNNLTGPISDSTTFASAFKYPRCLTDLNCPGDQLCKSPTDKRSLYQAGVCKCAKANEVLWKWHCYTRSTQLGDKCQVSRQCQVDNDINRHCNPITKSCECDVSFEPDWVKHLCVKKLSSAHSMPTTTMPIPILRTIVTTQIPTEMTTSRSHIHDIIYNAVLNSTSRVSTYERDDMKLTPEQVNTVLFIFVALFVVSCLGLVSALYVRNVNNKRHSRQALRSFMDVGSYTEPERNTTASSTISQSSSVFTVGCNYTLPDTGGGTGNNSSEQSSLNDWSSENLRQQLSSRLTLPPLEANQSLPSPHASAPVLPAIQGSLRRPRPGIGTGSVAGSDLTLSNVRAVSQSLNKLVTSAASFPPDFHNDNDDNDDFAATRM